MRDTARATTTNQPTNRAPNEPASPICAHASIFWVKNGRFWAKHSINRKQKFWYPHIRKPPNQLVRKFLFGRLAPNGSERPIFGLIWPKVHISGQSGHFWAQILLFGEGANVLVLAYQKTNYAPYSQCFLAGHSTKMDQKGKYLAKSGHFWAKSPDF